MEQVFSDLPLVGGDVVPDNEANPAQDNQGHDDQIDQDIVIICRQGGISPKLPHQVEARIAESRDGMENPIPDPLQPAKLWDKAQHQQQGADAFDPGGVNDNFLHEPYRARQLKGIDAFLD